MITSSDKEYIVSKAIKQGKIELEEPFLFLVKCIGDKYGVFPLSIFYEVMTHGNKCPRLEIVFETYHDIQFVFRDKHQKSTKDKFDNDIIKMFSDLINEDSRYSTENMFVITSIFSNIAKQETNKLISEIEIESIKREVNNKDIWIIKKNFYTSIFFFYTKEQVEFYRNSDQKELFKKIYFKYLKRHDEFGYISYDDFDIIVDSKEHFDNAYQSNWFYYFR